LELATMPVLPTFTRLHPKRRLRTVGGERMATSAHFAARPILEAGRRQIRAAQPAVDLLVLAASSVVAVVAAPPTIGPIPLAWALGFALISFITLRARGFYRFRLGGSIVSDSGRIATATALAAMAFICVRVAVGEDNGAASLLARLLVCSIVFLTAARAGWAFEARRRWGEQVAGSPTLVIGAGRVGRLVARRLRDRPELGLRPVGHIDDEPLPGAAHDLPLVGGMHDVERAIEAYGVEHVILTFARESDERLLELMRRCKQLNVDVAIVPRMYEEMTHELTVEHVGGIPFIRAEQPDVRGWQFEIKHAVDRVASMLLLVPLAPVLALIAVAVRLSSAGPIFFRQTRVGRDGRDFLMLKFRTMRGDPSDVGEADAGWADVIRREAHDSPLPAVPDRITRVGQVLRRLSMDELPQLFNVLRGEMSLIGPRPERTRYAREFEGLVPRYSDRYRVKAGLTGWAQVHGLRGETSLSDRVEWDNYYIENWTPWLDLKILLMTFPAVLAAAACLKESERSHALS
jgi:exopolysaccharide biosynthesis polyprenyl glycosylphosphotransferase